MNHEEMLQILRAYMKPGTTVYTILRHVSSSGMTRDISVKTIEPRPQYVEPVTISQWDYNVSEVLGWKRSTKGEGVRVGGAGMDMGYHLVYTLSRTLYPDGFDCIGEGCPSNDHVNDRGATFYSPERHHNDGGYALRHRWL